MDDLDYIKICRVWTIMERPPEDLQREHYIKLGPYSTNKNRPKYCKKTALGSNSENRTAKPGF